MSNVIISQQNDTVDAICHRYYGYTARAVENVYNANPKLCEFGAVLPMGISITMPAIEEKLETESVKLWD